MEIETEVRVKGCIHNGSELYSLFCEAMQGRLKEKELSTGQLEQLLSDAADELGQYVFDQGRKYERGGGISNGRLRGRF